MVGILGCLVEFVATEPRECRASVLWSGVCSVCASIDEYNT